MKAKACDFPLHNPSAPASALLICLNIESIHLFELKKAAKPWYGSGSAIHTHVRR